MKSLLPRFALLAVVLTATAVHAQTPPDGKDVSWKARGIIARRGTLVEHIGGDVDSIELDQVGAAAAAAAELPPDDSHKWFVSILVKRNDPQSDKLRSDFATSDRLRAWVDTTDHRKSWAHYQVFDMDDASQAYRWRPDRPGAYTPKRLPAVLVQPPFNGSWGRPEVLVFSQEGYDGAENLDTRIRTFVKAYANKHYPSHQKWESTRGNIEASGDAKPTLTMPETARSSLDKLLPPLGSGDMEQAEGNKGGMEGPAPFGPVAPLPNPAPSPLTPVVNPLVPNLTPVDQDSPTPGKTFLGLIREAFGLATPDKGTVTNLLLVLLVIGRVLTFVKDRTATNLDNIASDLVNKVTAILGGGSSPAAPSTPNPPPPTAP